jgi:hypothetical protein
MLDLGLRDVHVLVTGANGGIGEDFMPCAFSIGQC